MALHQGYNIVTEPMTDTSNELTALEFFRKLAADQPVECPVTVTGLDDLLYNATEDSRTRSFGSYSRFCEGLVLFDPWMRCTSTWMGRSSMITHSSSKRHSTPITEANAALVLFESTDVGDRRHGT